MLNDVKPGTRLLSSAGTTEMIVIKAPAGALVLTIGGHVPVTPADDREDHEVVSGHDAGCEMGKRYVDADGRLELLCTRPGDAAPALDGELLAPKDSKPLPASD